MNYEKADWGYFGKAFGSCAAVLGLAAGLAVFMPNKPATAQPLEKIVRKEALSRLDCGEKTTITPVVKDSVGENYKSRNFDTRKASRAVALGTFYGLNECDSVKPTVEMIQEAKLQWQNGHYKISDELKISTDHTVLYGTITVSGKEYGFMRGNTTFILFNKDEKKSYHISDNK